MATGLRELGEVVETCDSPLLQGEIKDAGMGHGGREICTVEKEGEAVEGRTGGVTAVERDAAQAVCS